ncbi:hypothetical protein [Labilibaculum euxinus]
MKNKFTVGSLYAGVGGICLGFKNSGFAVSGPMNMTKTPVLPIVKISLTN